MKTPASFASQQPRDNIANPIKSNKLFEMIVKADANINNR